MLLVLFAVIGVATIIAVFTLLAIWIVLKAEPSWLQHAWAWRTSWRKPERAIQYLRLITCAIAISFAVSAWVAWLVEPTSEWGGFRTEATGIAVAVIIFEEMARLRNAQEFKQSIIRQMCSRSNEFALDAARIAVENGWHHDGSLIGANLRNANLVGVELQGANLERASLCFAKLAGADLREARLVDADLTGADLRDSCLTSADLAGAYLTGVDLIRAHLYRANLRETEILGSDLFDSNLMGADFKGANLEGSDFAGAVYSKTTKWPDGRPPTDAINAKDLSEQERSEYTERWKALYFELAQDWEQIKQRDIGRPYVLLPDFVMRRMSFD